MKKTISLLNLGILTALASSLCCITPLIAILLGTGGIASTFSWLTPARPYFIGLSILVLVIAWYQKLKTEKTDTCGCDIKQQTSFLQSKAFLFVTTIGSVLLLSFPSYAYLLFSNPSPAITVNSTTVVQEVEFKIKGMSCSGCEYEVKTEVNKLKGIITVNVSYEKGSATVKFDNKQTNISEITKAINSTGYKVVQTKILA